MGRFELCAIVLSAAITSSYCASDERMDSSTRGSRTTGGDAGMSGSAGNAGAPAGATGDGSSGSAGTAIADAAEAGDVPDGSQEFGGCVWDCTHLAPEPIPGCPALPLCQMLPLTSLACFCNADRGMNCPATLDAGLELLRTRCEDPSGLYANSRVYHCAGRIVTVVAVNAMLHGADYFFDSSGTLIGVKDGTDCNCGPCGSFSWGAGDVDCEPTDECAPCPSDAGSSTIPPCADAGM